MDLRKDSLDKAKVKAEERITDWIENCQSAGITRLYDQYGSSGFKRIEYRKDDGHKLSKTIVPSKLRPLKQPKVTKTTRNLYNEPIGKESVHKKTDRGGHSPLKGRQGGERSLSRQTSRPDSMKKYRDSASIFREMNNKSSHNRSSYKSSVCSMDAISLMCDEPIDFHYYIPSKFDSRFKTSDFSTTCTNEATTIQHGKVRSSKTGNKSRFAPLKSPKHLAKGKPKLTTVARAERNFYGYNTTESFKPRMKKIVSNKESKDLLKIQKQYITEETTTSSEICDEESPEAIQIHPATSIHISSQVNVTRPPSTYSHIPVTFTIDQSSFHDTTMPRVITDPLSNGQDSDLRTKSSMGLRHHSPLPLVQTSSSCENADSLTPASKLTRHVASSLALKRNKSRLSRINLSSTPSTIARGKSATLVRAVSRRFPGGFPTSNTNIVSADKKAAILERFRKFTNKFIAVSRLLNSVKLRMSQQNREEVTSVKREQAVLQKSNVLDFDASYFKTATTSYGGLTPRARDALWKMVHMRTDRDIRTLNEVMSRLAFFNKYPESIKTELARMLWYDRFENGRVIIKQGDIGSRMYFVVSGCVSLQTTAVDPRTELKNVVHLKDVKSGSTFGELALIRDMKRTYTAVCKGDCEFLSLSKDEFNNVLRHKWEQNWQDRYRFVESLSSFQGATANQKKNATDMSEIKNFPDHTLIFGDKTEVTENVFFIMKGKCKMIKKISLVRSQSPYLRPSLFLPGSKKDSKDVLDKPYGKKHRIHRTENHMLTVMSLYPGDFFGVGEDLKDTFIITKGKVDCLLINSAFYAINLMVDRLDEMKVEIEEKIPSNRELYKKFEVNRKWTEYKKSLVDRVVKRKKIPNVTTKIDIPYVLAMEPSIPEDLIWTEKI